MPLLATQWVTLQDVMSRLDPNGKLASIAEYLTAVTPLVEDCHWIEGNLPTGNKTIVRTSEPDVYFREMNAGVPSSKSTTAAVDDGVAVLEGYHRCDRELAILSGDIPGYRMSEATAFYSAMGKRFSQTWWYGNAALDDKTFTGLTPRYNSLTGTTKDQIINAGGGPAADLRSIWLVVHGDQQVRGIYPRGTKGGLMHEDVTVNLRPGSDGFPLGDTITDSQDRSRQVYIDWFQWRMGQSVKDWRYVSRVANISLASITKNYTTGPDLEDLMIQQYHRIQNLNVGRPCFYACREIVTWLHRQANSGRRQFLSIDTFGGKPILNFLGIPIKRDDSLNVNEAQVV